MGTVADTSQCKRHAHHGLCHAHVLLCQLLGHHCASAKTGRDMPCLESRTASSPTPPRCLFPLISCVRDKYAFKSSLHRPSATLLCQTGSDIFIDFHTELRRLLSLTRHKHTGSPFLEHCPAPERTHRHTNIHMSVRLCRTL